MMKYYELHEAFWKQLSNNGHISWDRESKDDLMSRERNLELERFLGTKKNGTVLDLGSGSGSQSFYLSKKGFSCTAVDISQTAINIGKKLSKELDLDIEYLCEDVCALNLNRKFDIITDSCVLHCIVTDEDRKSFYRSVRSHMKEDGRFFIYTMIRHENHNPFKDLDYVLLDDDGVLWSKGSENFDINWTEINGEKYFPHRRLYTAEQQRSEILGNGFQIEKEHVIAGANDNSSMYIAWLKRSQE